MEKSPHPLSGENEGLLFVLVVSVGATGAASVHAFRSANDAAAFQQHGSVHLAAELDSIDGRPALGTFVQFKSFAALCSPDHWVVSVSVHSLIRGAYSEDWVFEELGAYGEEQRDRFLSGHRRERTSVEPRQNSLRSRKLTVGRHAEFDEVLRQLTANRISWLLGLPGTGKSELARLIWESSEPEPSQFPVRYVDLQSAKDGGLAGHAILRQLDARKDPMETPWAAVSRTLASFSGGLILDLSDPDLLSAPEQLPALLAAAPHLHVLLVSRTPSSGSTLPRYVLAGLACPGENVAYPEVLQFDAVKLFEDRCQTIAPKFRVNERVAGDVSELLREVSGNPLAIETLAKNANLFSPRQLLRRLRDRVRSLPQAEDPFWASLDVWLREQTAEDILILRLLCEVASPVTYEDVAALADGLLPSDGLIRVFRNLVTNSLVAEDPGWDDRRFFVESNVARWVRANHAPWDEADLRRRRAMWVMGLCRKEGASKFSDLDATFTDLAAVAEGDVEEAVQVAILAHLHWVERGYLVEGFQLLKRLGTKEGVVRAAGYSQLLTITSYVAAEVGEFSAARLAAKEAIWLAAKSGDFRRSLGGWCSLAHLAYVSGRVARAFRIAERVWHQWMQQTDDPRRPALACNILAYASRVPLESQIHRRESAIRTMREILAELEAPLSEPMLEATRCMNLIDWQITSGRFEDTPSLLGRGWNAFKESKNFTSQARILRNAAYWRVAMGDAAGAVRLFASARQIPYSRPRHEEQARSERQMWDLRKILGTEKYQEELLRGDLSDPEDVLKESITGI
jgi:predicted ATPase